MNKPKLSLEYFLYQVLLNSRGKSDNIFINPEYLLSDNETHDISQKDMQRCWYRAIDNGYASIDTPYSHPSKYGADCISKRNTYKIDREKIINDFNNFIKNYKYNYVKKECSNIENNIESDFYIIPNEILLQVNNNIHNTIAKLQWNLSLKRKKTSECISGRMNSALCQIKKNERKILYPELFQQDTNEYDISSTILALCKLLNKGVWVADNQDLKKTIIKNMRSNDIAINEKVFKQLLFRVIFSTSKDCAWANLNYTEFGKTVKTITKERFDKLYDAVIDECGFNKWGPALFYYESLGELYSIAEMQRLGEFVGSVYDCFWAKLPIDTMKQCTKNGFYKMYDYYSSYFLNTTKKKLSCISLTNPKLSLILN